MCQHKQLSHLESLPQTLFDNIYAEWHSDLGIQNENPYRFLLEKIFPMGKIMRASTALKGRITCYHVTQLIIQIQNNNYMSLLRATFIDKNFYEYLKKYYFKII